MSKLKDCLKKIGLESHEEAIINGAVQDLEGAGYTAHEAAQRAVQNYIARLERERKDIERQIAEGGAVRALAKAGAIGPPRGVRRSVYSQSKLWSPVARRRIEDRILRDALTNDAFFEMVSERRVPPLDIEEGVIDDYIVEAFPEWADEVEYVYTGVEPPERADFDTEAEYREALADHQDLTGWAAQAYRDAAASIERNVKERYQEHAKRILAKLSALEKEFGEVPKDLLASIRAYHGSKHRFTRFDSGKIGTGEGAQVFGWGLYFSNEKEVARHYAGLGEPYKGRRWSFDDVNWSSPEIDAKERAGLLVLLTDGRAKIGSGEWKTVEDARKDFENQLRVMTNQWDRYREIVGDAEAEYRRDAARAALAYLDKHPEAKILEPGSGGQFVYRVIIHQGKSPDQYDYLDWHEKVPDEQLEKVRKHVLKAFSENNPMRRELLDFFDHGKARNARPLAVGAKPYWSGERFYNDLAFELGFRRNMADKEASLLLLAAGIDGIKYRAGSLSGREEGYSRNYVVFDDSEVAIEALEDIQGRPVELAASVKGIPERFASTNEALAFGRFATSEQIEALRALYEESKARASALLKQKKFDEAMAEAAKGQFFREAIDAAEGRIDLSKWGDPLIAEKDTKLVDPEPGKFSFKKPSLLRRPAPVQAQLFMDTPRPAAAPPRPAAESKAPSVPPAPEAEVSRIRAELAPAAIPPKPEGTPGGVVPFTRVRMETTGSIAAAGNVVRDIEDAAALLAPIRKSAQELAFTVAVAADGTVLEIHRYSRGGISSATLVPADVVGRLLNTPGIDHAYFFHNHPSGDASPSEEDSTLVRVVRAIGSVAKVPVRSGIIAGTRFVELGEKGEALKPQPIRPTVRKTRLPVRERYLVQRPLEEDGPINNSLKFKAYLDRHFPGEQGILFLNAKLKPVGFMPWPDLKTPARATVETLKAREFVNAITGAIILDHKATPREKDFIAYVQDLSYGNFSFIDVLQNGVSAADSGTLSAFRSGAMSSYAVEQAARNIVAAEYHPSSLAEEARFSVRSEADRRFAAGITRWWEPRRGQGVRLDYTPDVLRMLGAESLPMEIDKSTIRKVLQEKHGRIGIHELRDLPLYLNNPIMVFDSRKFPGRALVVMMEIVDRDGDTVVAAIHLSKGKEGRGEQQRYIVNAIASVYGKDSDRFFLKEIEDGRLRYINRRKGQKWAKDRKLELPEIKKTESRAGRWAGLYLPRHGTPAAFSKNILDETDLVKFIREGRFSTKFQPVDTDSPAFKRWFGDSKVVDQDGKPMVVYHGTAKDFAAFERRPDELDDIGFHFGTRYQAEARLENRAQMLGESYEGSQVMPVYLSIQNPLPMPDAGNWTASMIAATVEMKGAPGLTRQQRQRVIAIGSSGEKGNTAKLRDYLKSLGYDGIVYTNRHEGAGQSFIAFDPGQIKSAITNVGAFDAENPDIRFSTKASTPVWYSHMERFLERKLPGSGQPGELARTIRGWANRGEIKAEELDWSGLEDWLKEQTGKVTKQQVLDWLAANNLRVGEVVKGGFKKIDGYWFVQEGRVSQWEGQTPDGKDSVIVYANNEKQARALAMAYDRDELGVRGNQLVFPSLDDLPDWVQRRPGVGGGQYAQWQLHGGRNYQELLLTLPERLILPPGWSVKDEAKIKLTEFDRGRGKLAWWTIYDDEGDIVVTGFDTKEEAIRQASKNATYEESNFKSGHFKEPNILVHVRFNERTTKDGKRMLFIEEVQSDWHQKGRKKGYRGQPPEIYKDGDYWRIKGWEGKFLTKEDAAQRYSQARESQGVPDAPFKTTWPLLAMKRMVRWAAENGFDVIGWTTGEQQAERYDLSKQVEAVRVLARKDGTYNIQALPKESSDYVMIKYEAKESELEGLIGKDLAKKAVAQKKGETVDYTGVDLKVGGEGMKGFYDRILPAELNKFFGKAAWGNARVGKAEIQTLERKETGRFEIRYDIVAGWEVYNKTTGRRVRKAKSREDAQKIIAKLETKLKSAAVHTLPVTPEMRRKALEEGLPLFSLKRLSPEARAYMEALQAAQVNLGKPAPSAKDLDADPFEGLPDDVKARLQAAKGIPRPGILDRARVLGADVWHSLTRHRPYLDPKADATITDILRTHQDTPRNSVRRALQVLQAIAGGLRPKQYEVFSMTLVMRDMIRDIDSGLLSGKEGLPFGLDEKTARSYLAHLERVSAEDPAVAAALRKREAFDLKLKQALVAAELLPQAVLKDTAYFHHQVLKYQALKALGGQYQGLGVGPTQDVRLRKKGWQIARTGSIEDYNTQYVQAEFEVIAQAFSQLETRDVMRQVAGRADISESLRQKAKRMNYVAVVGGEANFQRLMNLRAEAAGIRRDSGGKPDRDEKKRLKEISDEIQALDPTMPFRQRIAIGLQKLAKVLGIDADEAAFDDELLDMRELAKFAKSDDEEVSIPARMIFKAITEREAFIRETLGKGYATAERIIPDGYVEWLPKPGGSWYRAYSIPDRVAAQVLAGEVVLGAETAEKIRQVLARRTPETWIIPEGLAKTLDGYDVKFDDHVLAKASRTLMDTWKKWTLINPFRVVKYNLNNLSGDLDIAFAYDPRIVTRYLAGAIRDLWGDYREKKLNPGLKAEIDLANRLGVLDSGWSVQEVWDVAKELSLKEHMLALSGERPNLIIRGWKGLENFTRYRENWLRLAAFRYFRDRIRAGKESGEKVYGASNPAEVDGIEDPDRRAAKLARELIGDYGNITHAGQFIRRHLIPFYAWMEINAPRYVRLMRNLKHEGRGGQDRAAAVLGKNIAWKATKLGAKAAFLMAMVNLWNHTFFADEEDELGEEQRRQMHLILGRRKDGSIISLRFQGALSDALSWFGAEDVIEDVRKLRKGTASLSDIAKDAALSTPIKILNALRPDMKVLGEVVGGRSWYPDPFNPKPIRDKLQHVARTFSAGSLYDWAAGKPKRGGTVGERLANDLLALGFYTSDPGETAYYDIVKRVIDWREQSGKESPGILPTDKANALYYYKQALKFGDLGAAERYLKRYYELGGTSRGLNESIQRAHPLGMIAKKDRGAFLRTLSPEELERYRLALRWYQETYRGEAAAEVKAAAGREVPGRQKNEEAAAGAGGMTLREAAQLMR